MSRIGATLIFLAGCSLLGQDFRATITGQITDSSKAAVPGATVKAIQPGTNEATQTVTNKEGYYSLSYLTPNKYIVEVAAPGFKSVRRENVVLLVADKLDLSFSLEVGQMSTEITVTAALESIDSTNGSGGQNFDTLQTSEYPLNGRQAYMLMELAPGVLFTQEQFGANGFSGTRGWDTNGEYVMNGGVKVQISFC